MNHYSTTNQLIFPVDITTLLRLAPSGTICQGVAATTDANWVPGRRAAFWKNHTFWISWSWRKKGNWATFFYQKKWADLTQFLGDVFLGWASGWERNINDNIYGQLISALIGWLPLLAHVVARPKLAWPYQPLCSVLGIPFVTDHFTDLSPIDERKPVCETYITGILSLNTIWLHVRACLKESPPHEKWC